MVKKVAVVILNYKVKDDALECIASVKKSDYQNLEIIVVDNDSEDNIEQEIKGLGVNFIQTNKNLGYAGGNNIGIKKALDNSADFIFILNPDALLEKDTVTNLVKSVEKENIGVAGPKVLFSDKKTIWYAGGIFDRENVLGSHKGVDETDKGQYDEAVETDYITGAAFFIKKEILESIGNFDERFFLYYEDLDFCLRAKDKGFKVMFVPNAVVYHKNAKSTGLGSSLQDYFITRNRFLIAAKFLPLRTRFALFREALRNLRFSVRRLAFWDFLIGNFGKGSFKI